MAYRFTFREGGTIETDIEGLKRLLPLLDEAGYLGPRANGSPKSAKRRGSKPRQARSVRSAAKRAK